MFSRLLIQIILIFIPINMIDGYELYTSNYRIFYLNNYLSNDKAKLVLLEINDNTDANSTILSQKLCILDIETGNVGKCISISEKFKADIIRDSVFWDSKSENIYFILKQKSDKIYKWYIDSNNITVVFEKPGLDLMSFRFSTNEKQLAYIEYIKNTKKLKLHLYSFDKKKNYEIVEDSDLSNLLWITENSLYYSSRNSLFSYSSVIETKLIHEVDSKFRITGISKVSDDLIMLHTIESIEYNNKSNSGYFEESLKLGGYNKKIWSYDLIRNKINHIISYRSFALGSSIDCNQLVFALSKEVYPADSSVLIKYDIETKMLEVKSNIQGDIDMPIILSDSKIIFLQDYKSVQIVE